MSLFRSFRSNHGKSFLQGIVHADGTVTNVVKITVVKGVPRQRHLKRGAEYEAAVAKLKRDLPF
jgi:hypothetical protein